MELPTAGDVAKQLKVGIGQVRYVIEKLGIQPFAIAARTKCYSSQQIEQIRIGLQGVANNKAKPGQGVVAVATPEPVFTAPFPPTPPAHLPVPIQAPPPPVVQQYADQAAMAAMQVQHSLPVQEAQVVPPVPPPVMAGHNPPVPQPLGYYPDGNPIYGALATGGPGGPNDPIARLMDGLLVYPSDPIAQYIAPHLAVAAAPVPQAPAPIMHHPMQNAPQQPQMDQTAVVPQAPPEPQRRRLAPMVNPPSANPVQGVQETSGRRGVRRRHLGGPPVTDAPGPPPPLTSGQVNAPIPYTNEERT